MTPNGWAKEFLLKTAEWSMEAQRDELERIIRAAVEEERELCAKLVEDYPLWDTTGSPASDAAKFVAFCVRARGEKP